MHARLESALTTSRRYRVVLAITTLALVALAVYFGRAAGVPAGFIHAADLALDEGTPLPPCRFDLIELFPVAQASAETREIDFGKVGCEHHLLEGWSFPESAPEHDFVWGLGDASTLEFFAAEARDYVVTFMGHALGVPGAPEQRMLVELNGVPVTSIVIPSSRQEHELKLARELVRSGSNQLVFRYAYHRPAESLGEGPTDGRPLAVQWDYMRFLPDRGGETPRLETHQDVDELFLPFSSRLDYYLKIPAQSVFLLGDCRPWQGAGAARLEITIRGSDEGASRAIALPIRGAGSGPRALRLPYVGEGPVRFSLRAASEASEVPASAGLLIARPTLYTPELAVVAAAGAPANAARSDPDTPRPNVILYLVDTLRADHLGCYGYGRPTSPHVDAFAQDAICFEAAQAQSSWTRPAVASLMTGVYPQEHGVIERDHSLPDSLPLLAEHLAGLGYRTHGIITNPNVGSEFGFDRGFESFESLEPLDPAEGAALSDAVHRAACAFLETVGTDRPFFLYLHTSDPHDPYVPRSPYRETFAADVEDPFVGTSQHLRSLKCRDDAPEETVRDLIALYDAEVAFNDAQFGALLERLRSLDLYDESIVLFLSDHGEGFYDHGRLGHGRTLNREEVHVPLLLRLPGGEASGLRVPEIVRQVDVLPTLLDCLGEPVPSFVRGESVLPILRNLQGSGADRTSYAHLDLDRVEIESIASEGRKLIHTIADGLAAPRYQLYDLRADPLERESLADRQPIWLGYQLSRLRAAWLAWPQRWGWKRVELDAELRRKLHDLGYF